MKLKRPHRWRSLRKSPQRVIDRLLRFGRRLTGRVEDLVERWGQSASSSADVFESFESRLGTLAKRVAQPFKVILRLPQKILFLLISPQRLKAVWRPIRRAFRQLQLAFVRVAEALFLDRAAKRVAKLTKPVWYPFAAFGKFFDTWARTRKLKRLLWGIPLCALLLPLAALVAWQFVTGQESVAANYREAIIDARHGKDYPRLQLLERKLAQLGVDTRHSDFNTLLALERDGKLAEAYDRAKLLATNDGEGYAPAHFWIIQHLLSKKLAVSDDDAHRLAGEHFQSLSQLGAKGDEIELLRALWLTQGNQPDEAAKVLQPLVNRSPLAAVERFRLDLQLRHVDEARRDAMAVREHMQRQGRSGALLAGPDYGWWAVAEKLLNDPTRFRAVLLDWLKAEPNNPEAKKSLALIYLAEFDEILASPNPDADALAKRLQDAFSLSEIPDDIKQRLAILYQEQAAVPVLQEMFRRFEKATDLPSSLAELLGTVAGIRGQSQQSEAWLRQAIAKDPKNAVAWNNLANLLLELKGQRYDEALTAVNHAIELNDKDFRFRETRGQILMRLKQFEAATRDLEFALNGMPNTPAIHQSLATAYDAIGKPELAALHRGQSQ